MKLLLILFSATLFMMEPVTCQIKQVFITEYSLPTENPTEKFVILKMPYANFNILEISGDTAGLKNAGDIFVDVICTDYPAKLSLETINRKRYEEFFKAFPFIKHKQIQQINYLRQTFGAEKENALNMFHGVVIKYRPVQNEETMKNDIVKLDEILAGNKVAETKTFSSTPAIKPDNDKKDTLAIVIKHRPVDYSASVNGEGMSLKKAYKKGYLTKSQYKSLKKDGTTSLFENSAVRDTSYSAYKIPEVEAVPYIVNPLPDSTVYKVFTRNKWKNITVVGDVTGSMYPYTGQLLMWLKLHSLDSLTNKFAFFNDGDNMPDREKRIGETGGIYYRMCNNYDEVESLIKKTMRRGSGGDCPENNIEALLLSEAQFPESDCQVLIADNWANIKDRELIHKLKKPVRVVVCGSNGYYINPDYLNLAYKTKGSVHIIEQDLYNLSMLHDGETITIGKKKFLLKNGEFVDTNTTGNTLSISKSATL